MLKIQLLLALFVLTGISQELVAQKFGHINSAMIIDKHPKVTSANATLDAFKQTLQDSFMIKAKSFEGRYMEYMKDVQSGTLSQLQTAERQTALRAEQESLNTEEQQLQFRLLQKREELLKPILTEIDGIIQDIGKTGMYTMIFDVSVGGGLLFAAESEDLTEQVASRCMATK